MTFYNEDFTVKTDNLRDVAPPGWLTFMEICPINGFTTAKMISIPEICFLKDKTNSYAVMMWDMSDENQSCIKDLTYEINTGNWQFFANFYQIMGYNHQSQNHG